MGINPKTKGKVIPLPRFDVDFVSQSGPKAIVSRFKRLAEKMHQDNALIFKDLGIPFEPRWFLILTLLDERESLSVIEISKLLGLKHPSVISLLKELSVDGHIKESKDTNDKRKRLVALSVKGKKLLTMLKPVWKDMTQAAEELIDETGYDVLAVLNSLESALNQQSYYQRMRYHIEARIKGEIGEE